MRLLHSRNQVFESFDGESVPPYAILSHTWGSEEVSYQDMVALIEGRSDTRQKKGFFKIHRTCNQADHDGLEWVWIDTCNIDKTSSSELSEAINSMFEWYRKASICYAYFQDISCEDLEPVQGNAELKLEVLRRARWFTRGWTLQELIASQNMDLFCAVPGTSDWRFVGTKKSESEYLAAITGVDKSVLEVPDLLPTVSVARRMSWAARRQTTRPEDIAYCLLGLFQVNMPLLYGEGAKAFIRLQEEILKNSEDESLFAWIEPEGTPDHQRNDGILATHPRAFSESSEIVPYASKLEPCTMTNRGLRIESRLVPFIDSNAYYSRSLSCILHCRYSNTFETSISIAVEKDTSTGRYRRSKYKSLRTVTYLMAEHATKETIYIHKCGPFQTREVRHCHLRRYPDSESDGFKFERSIVFNMEKVSFSDALALREATGHALGKTKISWNLHQRALIAPTTEHGYFSGLWFSRPHSSDPHSSHTGFIALLALPNKSENVEMQSLPGVFLTPLMKTPNRGAVHMPLEAGFKNIKSSHSVLELDNGLVTATLTRESQFGDDTYALDIEFIHPPKIDNPLAHSLAPAIPEIKISDPDDGDITALVHENLSLDIAKETIPKRGALRPPSDEGDYELERVKRHCASLPSA